MVCIAVWPRPGISPKRGCLNISTSIRAFRATRCGKKTPGIELNTGALGHGLPVAVGLALAAKMSGSNKRIYVLTGDGELAEGSNWEAAMAAAKYGLDNLFVIVDKNKLQLAA